MKETFHILFVDDEKEALDGYKRVLFRKRKEWEIDFAENGKSAVDKLALKQYDLVISDIRMPIMDGIDLIYHIKEKYPNIIRIILSGHQDEIKAVKAAGAAHQLLAKPTEASELISVIEKSLNLHRQVKSIEIETIINGIGYLPTLPEIYLKLERELSSKEINIPNIVSIISQDIFITAKIMQLVNSSFIGSKFRISDLNQAVSMLGINIIKTLALHTSLFEKNVNPKFRTIYSNISNHSLKVANLAKKGAMQLKLNSQTVEDVFISGALHDIGKLVLLEFGENALELYKRDDYTPMELINSEFTIFNISHLQAGAYLLCLWGLPNSIVEAAAYHHFPDGVGDTPNLEIALLHICDSIVRMNNKIANLEIDDENIQEIFPELNFDYLNKFEPLIFDANFINNLIDNYDS
jgi:putative nucleotidyltransferase with HDIG domain